MSRRNRTTLAAVEKLIEQRRQFQDWLAKLGTGDTQSMPAHVVERVRNDYRARLSGVMAELADHTDALREALAEAEERHDGFEDQQGAKEDELAELKLRQHVGELDQSRFAEESGALQAALDGLKKDIASARRDIDRYEEILEVIAEEDEEKAPPPAPPPPPPEAKAEKEPAARPESAPGAPPKPEATAPAPEPVKAAPPRSEPRPPAEPKVAAPRAAAEDELEFLRSVTSPMPPSRQARASKTVEKAEPKAAPAPAPERAAEPSPTAAAISIDPTPHMVRLSNPDEAAAPAAAAAPPAKPKPADDAAGLKCGECGTLNRPTEWYCEKCGAELAAL